MTRDLPEGMIDAEPAGAWTSGDVADAETSQSSADAARAVQEEAPDQERSYGDGIPAPDGEDGQRDAPRAPDDLVEGAEIQQGEDPDLLTDDQARG